MSANVSPVIAGQTTAVTPYSSRTLPVASGGGEGGGPAAGEGNAQLSRLFAALGRYKWLILLTLAVGVGGGVAATRYIDPQFEVASTILLTTGQTTRGTAGDRGPIRDEQNFDAQGWIDLLRSFAIADSVVMKLALYLQPGSAADSVAFRNFSLNFQTKRFVPGEYTLRVDGARFTLRDKIGLVSESGIVGDSIGRSAGFAWAPARTQIRGDRTIKFKVRQPREASVETLRRLDITLANGSSLIILRLNGRAQDKPAETLNAWGEQFVRIAADLKTARVSQFSKILNAQRNEAADRLTAAERTLQQFRVENITLPTEGTAVRPGLNGLQFQNDPVLNNYFNQKFELEALRRDRAKLEAAAAQTTATQTPVEALFAVQTLNNDPIAAPLRQSLTEYMGREIQLRLMRRTMTDSNPVVVPRLAELATLQARIPAQLADVLTQLRARETELSKTIAGASTELQGIPARTINEEALRREVDGAQQLYTSLNARFAEAELSEKSAVPDVRVLDTAVMPSEPSTNTAPRIIALAALGGLGVGIGLAFLLDRLDRRFRYPSQVTGDLGLQILGIVPVIDQTRQQSPEQLAQIVEAFRSIRMNTRYACMPGDKVALTITSPSPNDGKSLIASNLALSFAEGGWRTLLIDGDLRRGQLNVTFDLPQTPGLIEYLEGTSILSEVMYPTNHENLMLLPSGHRHRRGPELLGTPRMQQLISQLVADFDAVIIDSPPLGAGTDAYALGTTTGNLALVLRSALTDMRVAHAKLRVLDQLPVQVIGAILNEIRPDGDYQYYSYDPEYAMIEEPVPAHAGQLAAGDDD